MENKVINLKHKKDLMDLGQRAIDYYTDTGLCVFCEADDCLNIPHEEHCNVGELADIIVDDKRVKEKEDQRKAVFEFVVSEKI